MPTVLIDGAVFKHSMLGAKLSQTLAAIEEAREAAALMISALNKAKTVSPADEGEARNQVLFSPSSVLTSVIDANKRLEPRERATLERCLSLPTHLNMKMPLEEVATFRCRPKKNGGIRFTWSFALSHRTAQNLVLRAMGCYFVPRPFQYTSRGFHKAIAATKKFVTAGHVYAARLDIKDFFGSFDASKLAPELPLPKKVVDHVVVGRHIAGVKEKAFGRNPRSPWNTHPPYTDLPTHNLLLQARQGIPQGSACSPIVAAFIMSRLAWNPSERVKLINYADDFLLLALDQKSLEKEIGRLQEAVQKLPGGHFNLHFAEQTHISKGIRFLGHAIQMESGQLKTSPTNSNLQAFMMEADRLGTKLGPVAYLAGQTSHDKALKCLSRLYAHTKGWLNAFRECDRVASYAEFLLKNIQDHAHALGVTMDQVESAVDPSMKFQDSLYAFNV